MFVALALILTSVILARYLTRQTDIPSGSDFSISMERTACFGFCPIYQVTVEGNGTVSYVGEMFVEVEGEQQSSISQSEVRRLARELERIDFMSLPDSYTDMSATDMPSAITTLRLNGEIKTVVHYHGDFSAPGNLTELENLIDELTNSIQWIEPSAQ
jgi:hypothetical protein